MPKTLLLADDSVTIQRVIELTFAHEDVRVVAVSDGRRALQWLDGERPDIVLVDVDVPEVNGYEIARHIKSSHLRQVPVLLLAGAFEPIDEERVRAVGCDGVLVKPFEPQQLVTRVHALLEREPEPVLAGVAERSVPASGTDPLMAPAVSFSDFRGPLSFATTGEPEILEPPSRPVWQITDAEEPVDRVRSFGRPDAPKVAHGSPAAAPPAATPPKVSLVSAFSALLAAEQTSPAAVAPVAPIAEATVEDAVRRVLVKMTDDLVRRIVVETAERMIREEIEKIKANPE